MVLVLDEDIMMNPIYGGGTEVEGVFPDQILKLIWELREQMKEVRLVMVLQIPGRIMVWIHQTQIYRQDLYRGVVRRSARHK